MARGHSLVRTFVLALCVLAGAARGSAGEVPGPGAWLVGLDVQGRTLDVMSAGDPGPLSHGDVGMRLSIDRLLTPQWALGISGFFGGTWLDWSDPLYNTAGKIEAAAWDARFGVDRILFAGARGMAFVGGGVEYGEARSWVHTLGPPPGTGGTGQAVADEGPRCFMTGGYARLGAVTPAWRRIALYGQVAESVYGAHASDPPFGTRFNWLGRSLAVSVGLRFEIARGRADDR
ncbi:MAG TPA: hypothetical protein VGK89_05885 [Candidatus Eisenbacteria bacterium]